MHIGRIMECNYREGRTQDAAFDEAFANTAEAEQLAFAGVWIAERHFAPPEGPAGIPSMASAPLIFASLSRTVIWQTYWPVRRIYSLATRL